MLESCLTISISGVVRNRPYYRICNFAIIRAYFKVIISAFSKQMCFKAIKECGHHLLSFSNSITVSYHVFWCSIFLTE